MADGSGSAGSRSHTVRVAYWKVSTAAAEAPQPGRAQKRGRNIRATYPGPKWWSRMGRRPAAKPGTG